VLKELERGLCVMQHCNFLTAHGEALNLITRRPSITTDEMASALGITKSKVRRVMADLVDDGYVSKNKNGKELVYQIVANVFLDDEKRREVEVLEYLRLLLEKKSR